MKILLVDDDSFLRDMYSTKFKESSHEVSTAATGEEGLRSLEEEEFDAVLLDMVMPGIDGIEFLKEALKRKKAEAKTKYIVLSSQDEESDRASAREAGADGYIVKAESIPSDVVKKVEAFCASE